MLIAGQTEHVHGRTKSSGDIVPEDKFLQVALDCIQNAMELPMMTSKACSHTELSPWYSASGFSIGITVMADEGKDALAK
jgi:hypothetical protein